MRGNWEVLLLAHHTLCVLALWKIEPIFLRSVAKPGRYWILFEIVTLLLFNVNCGLTVSYYEFYSSTRFVVSFGSSFILTLWHLWRWWNDLIFKGFDPPLKNNFHMLKTSLHVNGIAWGRQCVPRSMRLIAA